MSRRSLVAVFASIAAVYAFAPRDAHAQPAPEPTPPTDAAPTAPASVTSSSTTTTAATTPAPVDADKPKKDDDEDDDFRSVALTANPLSLILTRIGVNVEFLPVKHHAAVLNPYFQVASVESGGVETSYTTFGGELGYRFYTGSRGANGFFVGPSAILQSTNSSVKSTVAGNTGEASSNITVYGAALDLGGQHVTKGGFTIGGGAGVMYLTASNTNTATSSTFKVSGVLPRFLFTVGYSF